MNNIIAKFYEFKNLIDQAMIDEEIAQKIDQAPIQLSSTGYDPWGMDPEVIKKVSSLVKFLYTDYFRVEVSGIENIPKGRCLLIANHGGQLPMDGMLLALSALLEGKPPRIVRGMVERWLPTLPFLGNFFKRCGQIVGDPKNCLELLEHDEAVMVFPEGVGGSGKLIYDRYKLQKFGSGFLRLALKTNTPIVPVSIIGSEETYPAIYNLESLAKLIKAPYIPVTPFFPLLGPLGVLPLPCKISIRYSPPMVFEGDPLMPEDEAQKLVRQVKDQIQIEINRGLELRGENIFTGSGVSNESK